MTDAHLFYLDADQQWDLAFDPNQWIIRRRNTPRMNSKGAHSAIYRWEGKWFVGGKKCALHPFISGERPPLPPDQRPRIVLTSTAVFWLEALPQSFREFREMSCVSLPRRLDSPHCRRAPQCHAQ